MEIRVAPFALPPTLEADSEMAGLPRPKPTKTAKSSGGSDSVRREMEVAVIAELPATLAFYRRELASRNWTEETKGAVVTPDNVTLNFSSAEQIRDADARTQIRSDRRQSRHAMTEAALAARARAKKEADEKFMSDAAAMAKQVIAADEVRRVAQAADLSDAPLRALGRQRDAGAVAGERGKRKIRRRRRQARIQFLLQREGDRRILSWRAEVAGLEGAALGHQSGQHGRDGVFQRRQGVLAHRHADGAQGQGQRRWYRPGDGERQSGRQG